MRTVFGWLLVLAVAIAILWRVRTHPILGPDFWICPCCRQPFDEPAPNFDPADLDPICPNCGAVLRPFDR